MKRAMAGEYSRELSAKVFTGQCRLIGLGFRQGGMAGYGLRRELIDEHRQPKGELPVGARKSFQTDRVILVPGPEEEVETVRRVYRMFLDDRRSEREIASILNSEGIATDLGRPWTRGTVHQLLTNEKYIGNNVYNRNSFKLKKKRVANPPDMWIRTEGAFKPIIDVTRFQAVRTLVQERNRRFTDPEMLDRLAALLTSTGWLSGLVIDEQEDMPSSSAYRSRFGTLVRAYRLVGYSPGRDYQYVEVNRILRAMHPKVVAETIAGIERIGGAVQMDPASDLLTVNDEFTASIVISRSLQTAGGALRWKIRIDAGLCPDVTVALRMDSANREILDYYLLPRLDVAVPELRIREENGFSLDAYRFDSLDSLFWLAARTCIRTAA
jgi:hypothetical protein